MSSHEFAEWMAYARLEPFGQDRFDIPAAIVAATVANVHRSSDTNPYEIKDFLPNFEPQEPQTWKQQLSIVELLNAAFGGDDKR